MESQSDKHSALHVLIQLWPCPVSSQKVQKPSESTRYGNEEDGSFMETATVPDVSKTFVGVIHAMPYKKKLANYMFYLN